MEAADYRVLFVCMGNICRSPTAEGVFARIAAEELADYRVFIDSAGTHAYHVGSPPDRRAQTAAERRGIDLSTLRARRVESQDFETFDVVIAMDPLNVAVMTENFPDASTDKVRLFLEYATDPGRDDVPDPYYGGAKGFEYVLDLAEEAARGLAAHIKAELRGRSKPID